MKKIILLLTALLAFVSSGFAQISSDPNNTFYEDAQIWERNGIIETLPPIRPYPVGIIKKILTTVIEKGNESQAKKAQEYLEELTGRPFHAELEIDGNYKNSNGENLFALSAFPEVNGDVSFLNDIVGLGYKLGFSGYTKNAIEYMRNYVPYGYGFAHDSNFIWIQMMF